MVERPFFSAVATNERYSTPMPTTLNSMLTVVRDRIETSGRFAEVTSSETGIQCRAQNVESDAWYSVDFTEAGVFIVLATPDRWLSESIEADLMHNGDSLEELIEAELIDLDVPAEAATVAPVERFQSDDFLYTYRSQVTDETEETIIRWLLAYEAAFVELGDMGGDDEA